MPIAGSVLGKSKDSKVRKSIASAKVACSKSALKGDAGCHVSCKSKVSFSLNQVLGFSLSLVFDEPKTCQNQKHLVFRFWKYTRCQPYNPTTRQSGGIQDRRWDVHLNGSHGSHGLEMKLDILGPSILSCPTVVLLQLFRLFTIDEI